jgi:hypothetical protein
MATPGTAPWLIPAPQLSDAADIETAVVPLRDRVQVLFGQQQALIDAISANDWVTAARIAAGAVGSSEIADLSVGTAELTNDAVTAAKIATDAVGQSEIAAASVGTGELIDSNVTAAKLATDALQTFLQLGTPGTRKVGFGTAAPGAWGGVAQRDWTVAHGLGANPIVAFGIEAPIGTVSSGGVALPVIVGLLSKDATNLTFRGRTADGATTNNANSVFWLAIA